MENKNLILEGEDILLVKKTVIVREYRADASAGFAGKKYRLYAHGANAFAVHEDDTFHQDFTNGQIYKIMLVVTDEGWSLSNYITFRQAIAQKSNKMQLDSITVENFKPQSVKQLEELS